MKREFPRFTPMFCVAVPKPKTPKSKPVEPTSVRTLALVATLTAFAAVSASATQCIWLGNTDTNSSTASSWNSNGVAQTNGTFAHRLNVSNTTANNTKPDMSSSSILPTLDASGSNFTFKLFRRTDSAVDTNLFGRLNVTNP
jgi:hypothetical protein